MIEIYHNPRCSKSREAIALLEEKKVEYKIIEYLKKVPTPEQLQEVIDKLDISPIELIRQNEQAYKEEYKDKEMGEEEWILAMVENPKLIERPIIINGDQAVIGRPVENILNIL